MSDIFISYEHHDIEHARTLAEALEKQGWTVWWDRNIPPGKSFDEVITEALGAAGCVVVVWSESSVHSNWVKEEAAEAARRSILLPVKVDDVEIPLGFRRIQTASLIGWHGDSGHVEFRRICDSITEILRAPQPASGASRKIPCEPTEATPSAAQQPSRITGQGNRIAAVIAFLAISILGGGAGSLVTVFLLGQGTAGQVISAIWGILISVIAFVVAQRLWSGKHASK